MYVGARQTAGGITVIGVARRFPLTSPFHQLPVHSGVPVIFLQFDANPADETGDQAPMFPVRRGSRAVGWDWRRRAWSAEPE
jgi:hypothetical protein